MIKSTLNPPSDWIRSHSLFPLAFDFLKSLDPRIPTGRHDLQGDRLFANVQSYETRPPEQIRFEAHRRYIDIQYILEGSERMACIPVGQLLSSEPYSAAKDIEFFHAPNSDYFFTEYYAGDLAVFFPDDAHKPCCSLSRPQTVKKIVLKVAVFEN